MMYLSMRLLQLEMKEASRLRTAARNRENWHNKEMRFKWKMDNRVRQEALSKCGVNT